jgi:hypothetical protein
VGEHQHKKGKLPITVPPESIRNIIDKSRGSAEELMQSVEDSIVENAEVGYNLLIQMAQKMNIGDAIPPPSLCLTAVKIKLDKAISYRENFC